MSNRGDRRLLAVTGAIGAAVLVMAVMAAQMLQPGSQRISAQTRALPAIAPPQAVIGGYSSVVGLGDSVTAAAACSCPSFVAQLGVELTAERGTQVIVVNEGVDGLTSHDLLQQVTQSDTKALPGRVTAIAIGANDFDPGLLLRPGCAAPRLTCYQQALTDLSTNVDRLLSALGSGTSGSGPVLLLGYWNVFLDGTVGASRGAAYQQQSEALTKAVNSVLAQEAGAHSAVYVDLYAAFKRDNDDTALLAPDGDHPSAAGHTLIAALLSQALGLQTRAGLHTSP